MHPGSIECSLAVRFLIIVRLCVNDVRARYNLDPSETWLRNLVHHVYTTPVENLSFRRLSLLFIMMAIGLLVDLEQRNESPRAEVFHRLARASLCEMNLMDEPSLDLLQTLVRWSHHLSCGCTNEIIVLHDLVPSYFLRQESSGSICMEYHGTCREACSKRGFSQNSYSSIA